MFRLPHALSSFLISCFELRSRVCTVLMVRHSIWIPCSRKRTAKLDAVLPMEYTCFPGALFATYRFVDMVSDETEHSVSWEADSCSASQGNSLSFVVSKVHWRFRKNPPLHPIRRHMHTVYTLIFCFSRVRCNNPDLTGRYAVQCCGRIPL
jgi:hypothetical protein